MISALAFGYGVGMAAPESTLSTMRTSLGPPGGVASEAGRATSAMALVGAEHAWAGRGPTAVEGYPPTGYPAVVYYPYGYPPKGAVGAPSSADLLGPGSAESRELSRLRALGVRGPGSLYPPDRSGTSKVAEQSSDGLAESDTDGLDPASHEALSHLQLPDFNVPISKRALTYVRFLTRSDRGRDLFETWLKRSGRYQDTILEQLRERALPEDLIWVAMIESGFDPRAKSPAGAVGLWQFMKPTGEVYGLQVTPFLDLRRDPVAATIAASHHLRDLYHRFGAWDLALAAYNMGYEQLLSAIDQVGTTDFNELARQHALPDETSAYVPKIVAAALVANNLERYGFDEVKISQPLSAAEITVPGGTPLAIVAKAAGMSTGALRTYNPHMLTGHVPPGGDYAVYVPAGALSQTRAALPAMLGHGGGGRVDAAEGTLDPVDLLGGLGKRRARTHRLWDEDENLLSLLPKPKRHSLRGGAEAELGASADEVLDPLAQEFGPERKGSEMVMYRVAPNDTLGKVAKQFKVDVDDLARDNGLDTDSKLREGSQLKLLVDRRTLDRWGRKGAIRDDDEGLGASPRGDGSGNDAARGRSEPDDKPRVDKSKKAKKSS
jgi:membrane-bound lytic murein transglycosylase D